MKFSRLFPYLLIHIAICISIYTAEDFELEAQDEQPSSHRLAKSMGVDARNMQVMKASFFAEDEAPSGYGKFFLPDHGYC